MAIAGSIVLNQYPNDESIWQGHIAVELEQAKSRALEFVNKNS